MSIGSSANVGVNLAKISNICDAAGQAEFNEVDKEYLPDELARRAAMFEVIANLVKTWDGTPLATNGIPTLPTQLFDRSLKKTPSTTLLPMVTVREQRVICNGASIDLSRRPLTLRLFQVFCAAPHVERTREDLLTMIYRINDLATRSPRYVESVYNNAIKLISRARILAMTHLSYAVGNGVEWFVYDQERKTWCLYRLRPRYLSDRLDLLS